MYHWRRHLPYPQFYFSPTQGDYQLPIAQARSSLRFDSAHDESFFDGADDNRCGLNGGASLNQAEFGKLVQKIKALNLGFQPAQIIADSKTCTKLSKGLETTATKDSFLAAAKRLGLAPKLVPSTSAPVAPTPAPEEPDDAQDWQTVGKRHSPKAKAKPAIPPPSPKPRKFSIVPDGWSVPILSAADVRPDTAGICPIHDEKLAHETWVRCKSSSKAIALLGPRDMKVGSVTPKMLLVPFFEQVEGLPNRKIDLQVWLHQLTEHEVLFASPRQVVDMGHSARQTKVFRAHLDPAIISSTYRNDFLKGNKAIMRTALAPILGDKVSRQVLDLWSPKLNKESSSVTFFLRTNTVHADNFLKLSRPDHIPIDTPLEDSSKYKHVWLKAEGVALSQPEVDKLLSSYEHYGALPSRVFGPFECKTRSSMTLRLN